MSDLRLFADTMHALIAAERRIAEIERNARSYAGDCRRIREQSLPTGDRPSADFDRATEGLNAARIILREAP